MKYIIIILALTLSGCGTMFGSDNPKIDRIQTERVYEEIPEEFLVCPPPPVYPDEIIMSLTEDTYNRIMVLEYFTNNETCWQNMRRIQRLNDRYRALNEVNGENPK